MECRVVQPYTSVHSGSTIRLGTLDDEGFVYWTRRYTMKQDGAYIMWHRVLEKGCYWWPRNEDWASPIIIVPSIRNIDDMWLQVWAMRNYERYGLIHCNKAVKDLRSSELLDRILHDYAREFQMLLPERVG